MEKMIDLNLQPQIPNDDENSNNLKDFQEQSNAFNLDSFNSSAPTSHPSSACGCSSPSAFQPRPSTLHWSSSSKEMDVGKTPNYKERLRMMRHYIREMSKCWDEGMCEEEKDRGIEDNNVNVAKANSETDFEETVFVERAAGSLIIQFRCPCGKGYQIFLSGGTCYYKVI